MQPRPLLRAPRPGTVALGRVAVPGGALSWSDLALDRLAAEVGGPDPVRLYLEGFAAAVAVVADGRADHALLPVANTVAGPLEEVRDLLAGEALAVAAETEIAVPHCLAGPAGATAAGVGRVLSHPVALRQCRRFLATLPGVATEACADTARAAAAVAAAGDPRLAAICSEACARHLGLAVLRHGVADVPDNVTRFVLVARRPPAAARP